jgi:CHAT domain-containing protein/tetratricopeptide (TPR) repeat protein
MMSSIQEGLGMFPQISQDGVGFGYSPQSHGPLWPLLVLVVMIEAGGVAAEAGPAAQQLTPAQKERLKERDRYARETTKLRSEGKLAEAIAACEKMLAIEREVFGNGHEDVVGSLEQLAEMQEEREDFAAAGKALQEVLAIQTNLHGQGHWQVTDAHRALADLELRMQLGPDKRAQLKQAHRLREQVGQLERAGKGTQALPLARKVVEIYKEILGEAHPYYSGSLNNLALLYDKMGDYARAEPLYRQALEIKKKALGEAHPNYAVNLSNLGLLYNNMGDYARAEPLYRQTVEIMKRALGEAHPGYSRSLYHLAVLYINMGDYARAEPLQRQALEIAKKALGEAHPQYAINLNNVALLYDKMGDYTRAEALFRQALEIKKKALGEAHPDYAVSLGNLALVYRSMGDYVRAERLARQAQEIKKKALGEAHPDYAISLTHLALVYYSLGDYERAEPLCRQALQIRQKALGEVHPDYATSLKNLGHLYLAQGDPTRAEPLLRASLNIIRGNLDLTAAIQSERQQLAMAQKLRYALDDYLSLGASVQASGASAYSNVLRWKGAVFALQQGILHARHEPALAPLYEEWQSTSRRLATLAFAVPEPKNQQTWRKQLTELTDKKEHLEGELSRRSDPFRTQREQQQRTPADVQAALPKDAALIDFLGYGQLRLTAKGMNKLMREAHLAAFVVRANRPVEQVDLGPLEEINKAINAWRAAAEDPVAAKDASMPAAALQRLLWQPLEKYLDGVRAVLISPDGALAQFPFAALPGKRPGRCLLEEVSIAVVPVPQLLPELIRGGLQTPGSRVPNLPESLLLVGDVNFGSASSLVAAGASRSAPRGSDLGGLPVYPPLQATRGEILAVRDSFERRFPNGRVQILRGEQATEAAVREQAPRHRWLHLATHGFFAPPTLRSALGPALQKDEATIELFGRQGVSGFHPGLLSGLVLAGANRPAQPDQDDGILTASEVAGLDLRGVELAVLSACETGLGPVAGGEGLLGLQRAFQVSGARSVVASLWQVDDSATQALMLEFYRNLWDKKLSKMEALRQAQLAILQRYDVRQGQLRGSGVERPVDPKKLAEAQATQPRLPPLYWAGFVLSGDWR